MPLQRTPRLMLVALLPVLAATTLVPCAWADINVSDNLTNTLDKLSTDTSTKATDKNLRILDDKLDSLNAQIRSLQNTLSNMAPNAAYVKLQNDIARLKAVASALQGIITKLENDYTITDYAVSTDESTQDTKVTITFTQGNATSTVSVTIPSGTNPNDPTYPDTSYEDPSTQTPQADPLTQLLQQLAMQMMGGQTPTTPQNPFSNIQNPLNSLMNNNGSLPLNPATTNDANTAAAKAMMCGPTGSPGNNDGVAVYDISAGKVYMPDGSVLEAHSGMGAMKDNPAFVNQVGMGPTPPNVYNLSMRESPYYGVAAMRLTPTNPGSMYGRDGMLAHTKLVSGNNGSHGCVAFANYDAFLAAYKSGQVKQLVVVGKLSEEDLKKLCKPPEYNTASPQGK